MVRRAIPVEHAALNAHRHDHVLEVFLLGQRHQHRGVGIGLHRPADCFVLDAGQHIEQVADVKANVQTFVFIINIQLFDGFFLFGVLVPVAGAGNSTENIEIRDSLAMERTKLANERTLLSYTQASLYFLLGGLALLQLKEYQEMHYIGYLALVFSVLFVTVGIWRFIVLKNKMKDLLKGEVKEAENPSGPEGGS